jgi:hypothetical protein
MRMIFVLFFVLETTGCLVTSMFTDAVSDFHAGNKRTVHFLVLPSRRGGIQI